MVKYVVVTLLVLARMVAADIRPFESRKFDHAKHASGLDKRHIAPVACAHCHPTSGDGKARLTDSASPAQQEIDHAFCTGSQCHGKFETTKCEDLAQPKRVELKQFEACNVCHFRAAGSKCFSLTLPPVPDWTRAFGHGGHVSRGGAENTCVGCHDPVTHGAKDLGKRKHELCVGCHTTSKTLMTACESCHGAVAVTPASIDPNRIDSFPHTKHAGHTQAKCIECHGVPNGKADDAHIRAMMLPPYTDATARNATPNLDGTCGKCHDGSSEKKFSVVGTKCMKCHAVAHGSVPATNDKVAFSHDLHKAYGVDMGATACDACHAVKSDGTIDKPGTNKDHQPCAKSGCHAARDFANKSARICGVCHDGAAPWAHATSRPRTPSQLDWFQNINHAAHLKNPNMQCESCHGQKLATELRPHNHEDCAPCHGKGQQPPISTCIACHSRVTPTRAPVSEWSVATAFDHGKHGRDNRAAPPTCVSCHASVPAAQKLADITTPRMFTDGKVKGCDTCHDGVKRIDGKIVFKTTGFGCAKCHKKPEVAFR